MKTTAQKLMVAAMVAFLTLTLNAQNTKSIHTANFTKVNSYISEKVTHFSNEIASTLESLKAGVKYSPSSDTEFTIEETELDLSTLTEYLEENVKFNPSTNLPEYNTTTENEINSVLAELETDVKYVPSQLINSDLNDIVAELSINARFYPAVAI